MRGRMVFFSWICVALAAVPAAAAEAAGDSVRDLVYRMVNLLLLLAVLFYFARRPIGEYFADRRTRIQDEIRQAGELRREAEERHAKWQRRLVDLETEIASIRETARERAERERQRILADAHATAQRLRSEANAAIERELRRAVDQLRNEASDLALELAAEILRDKVSAADQSRLLDEFIHRIESSDAVGERG
jgi:F-type H+-transporting ATPase subunit b